MQKLVLIRNITLVFSILILIGLLFIYLWGSRGIPAPASNDGGGTQLVTNIKILTGYARDINQSGFTLALENTPPDMGAELNQRTVTITPQTEILKSVQKPLEVYEAELKAFQINELRREQLSGERSSTTTLATSTRATLAELAKLSPAEQALGTSSFNPDTQEVSFVTIATSAVPTVEAGDRVEPPDPYSYETATMTDIAPDTVVAVFAAENIYATPSFPAVKIIIQ